MTLIEHPLFSPFLGDACGPLFQDTVLADDENKDSENSFTHTFFISWLVWQVTALLIMQLIITYELSI